MGCVAHPCREVCPRGARLHGPYKLENLGFIRNSAKGAAHHTLAAGNTQIRINVSCPSWSVLAKKFFPETIDKISNALTPMVATARKIKEASGTGHPFDQTTVFLAGLGKH